MVWSGIALFYFACLVFGFLSAFFGIIFGEISGHGFGHGGIDHGIGHGGFGHSADIHGIHTAGHEFAGGDSGSNMPGASVMNSITIATFVGFLGISGLVSVWWLKLGAFASVLFSLPASIVIAAIEFYLYVKLFVYAQASSEATMDDVLGCEAVVISSIPGDRVGEISYVVKGSRFTAPAASEDGEEISRGTKVRVINIRGATLIVKPIW